MFFILSKTIDFLLMPIIWLIGVGLWAYWTKKTKRKKRLIWAFLVLFLVLTNPTCINTLLLSWEVAPTPLADLKENYEVGIVLTGIVNYTKSPHDRVYLDTGADRIMHALLLYRKGKIKKILITGGIVDITGGTRLSEAQQLATVLHLAQVPKEDIILEENARNTRENALLSQKTAKEKFPQVKQYLLITSAFHQRRALGCFRKAGLNVTPFSAGVLTHDFVETGWKDFVPTERSLYLWQVLAREWVGYVMYWGMGYI